MEKRELIFIIILVGIFLIDLNFVLAAPTCELISRTPSDINDSSAGYFNILINCSDANGINVTKVGNTYSRAFLMRTVDNYVISVGPP